MGSMAGKDEVKANDDLEPSHPLEDFLSSGNMNKSGDQEGNLKDFSRKKRC